MHYYYFTNFWHVKPLLPPLQTRVFWASLSFRLPPHRRRNFDVEPTASVRYHRLTRVHTAPTQRLSDVFRALSSRSIDCTNKRCRLSKDVTETLRGRWIITFDAAELTLGRRGGGVQKMLVWMGLKSNVFLGWPRIQHTQRQPYTGPGPVPHAARQPGAWPRVPPQRQIPGLTDAYFGHRRPGRQDQRHVSDCQRDTY